MTPYKPNVQCNSFPASKKKLCCDIPGILIYHPESMQEQVIILPIVHGNYNCDDSLRYLIA